MERNIQAFTKGIHDRFSSDIIPDDAFATSQGWQTIDGRFELMRGRYRVGSDGGTGQCDEVHIAYTTNGTVRLYRKASTKVQYWNGTSWDDVITGLTAGAPTRFSNYSSLAGAFVYVFSTDGLYKICTANPTSYASLYDSAKNFKGIGFIDKGRTILWGVQKDPTGLYGSWIDAQNSTTYTTVSSEAITDVASGTLAFKAGGAKRTCFAVQITDTSSGEVFTDDYNGNLTGDMGGTGTINYMTGAFTITGQSGAGTANYQWEDSNVKGVTDFTKSAPRQASEGFIFRQDIGGDAIKNVLPIDGVYYSMKERSVYRLALSDDDTDATNEVFRSNIGVPSSGASTATSKGIVLLDTANGERPLMRIITRNLTGDNFDVTPLFAHFEFANYEYDDARMFTYGDYILLACKADDASANNVILVCDFINNTVDIAPYEALSFAQDGSILYTGDSLSANVYKTFNGFDDLGNVVENYATGKNDDYGVSDLKKTKKLRIKGMISTGQSVKVYCAFDESTFELLGTISGYATYVDVENPNTIGLNLIGHDVIGGSDAQIAYPYYCELKIKTPKFQKRQLKFVAQGFGHASVESVEDWDIWTYERRMPKRYRQKQNVSINDGTTTDLPEPNY